MRLTEELVWMVEPAEVKECRMGPNGLEVPMMWKNLPEFEATWELAEDITLQFSDFHLGDKVSSLGGSINKPLLVYSRKKKKLAKPTSQA